MRVPIIKIGNSRGLRLPKPILEQTGIKEEVEIAVEGSRIIIRPANHSRAGWDAAFKAMKEKGDDKPLIDDSEIKHGWDEDEWEW